MGFELSTLFKSILGLCIYIECPIAFILVVKFLDINIVIFALILITIGLLIDYTIYLNSAPVEVPEKYINFQDNIKTTLIRWFIFIFIFWLLGSTICAMLTYLGMTNLAYIIDLINYALLSTLLLHDLQKLKYTKFYGFPMVKFLVDTLNKIFNNINLDKHVKNGQSKEQKG